MPAADIPRYLEKFTSTDGTLVVTLPTLAYEYQRQSRVVDRGKPAAGLNFGFPAMQRRTQFDVVTETARFVLDAANAVALDTAFDTMRATAYRIGFGWLYTLGADGSRRRAYADLTSFLDITMGAEHSLFLPSSLSWRRYSHWYASALTSFGPTTFLAPGSMVVNNPGTIPVELITVNIKANTAAGYNGPKVVNNANNFVLHTSRASASIGDQVNYDLAQGIVERVIAGVHIDDFAAYYAAISTLPYGQLPLTYKLEPGNNTLDLTGVTNADVTVSFNAPYA